MVFHDFGSKFNLQQNRHNLKALFMQITMVQIPASYLIPSPRYTAQNKMSSLVPRPSTVHTVRDQKLVFQDHTSSTGPNRTVTLPECCLDQESNSLIEKHLALRKELTGNAWSVLFRFGTNVLLIQSKCRRCSLTSRKQASHSCALRLCRPWASRARCRYVMAVCRTDRLTEETAGGHGCPRTGHPVLISFRTVGAGRGGTGKLILGTCPLVGVSGGQIRL